MDVLNCLYVYAKRANTAKKKKPTPEGRTSFGGPGWNWTSDTLGFNQVLYQRELRVHMAESAEFESDTVSSTIRLAGGPQTFWVHSPYWLGRLDSDQRIPVSETGALTTWLHPNIKYHFGVAYPFTTRASAVFHSQPSKAVANGERRNFISG